MNPEQTEILPPTFSLDEKIFSTCSTEECHDDCQCEKISYNDLKEYFLCMADISEDMLTEEEFNKS